MIAPVGGVLEEPVVAEVLDVEFEAAAAAPVDGAAVHVGEVAVRQVLVVAHVDDLPHGGVQAEGAPGGAHQLRGREDLDGAKLQEDRRRDLPRELQPVALWRRGLVGGRHLPGRGGAERRRGGLGHRLAEEDFGGRTGGRTSERASGFDWREGSSRAHFEKLLCIQCDQNLHLERTIKSHFMPFTDSDYSRSN